MASDPTDVDTIEQRLDELHAHLLGQATDVVVRLDHVRLAGLRAGRFDDVGVDRALRQPLDALELVRLFVEDLDEVRADDLALSLRVRLAGQRREEADDHEIDHHVRPDAYTGVDRSFAVVADGVGSPADPGVLEHQPHRHVLPGGQAIKQFQSLKDIGKMVFP